MKHIDTPYQNLINRHYHGECNDCYDEKFDANTTTPLNDIVTDYVNDRMVQYVKRENGFVAIGTECAVEIQKSMAKTQYSNNPAPTK
jgi:hypothetical protein